MEPVLLRAHPVENTLSAAPPVILRCNGGVSFRASSRLSDSTVAAAATKWAGCCHHRRIACLLFCFLRVFMWSTLWPVTVHVVFMWWVHLRSASEVPFSSGFVFPTFVLSNLWCTHRYPAFSQVLWVTAACLSGRFWFWCYIYTIKTNLLLSSHHW